jgi:hypothetical protein
LDSATDSINAASDNFSNLGYALAYARRGWYVFPCFWIEDGKCACGQVDCSNPGKHPLNKLAPRGVLSATIYQNVIRKWWTRYPKANVATAAGPSKLIFWDIDPRHGGDESILDKTAGVDWRETIRVLTPSGGPHRWSKQPDDRIYTVYASKQSQASTFGAAMATCSRRRRITS